MHLTGWQKSELQKSLDALCSSKAEVYFYFPPDNLAIIAHYRANDAQGFAAFKKTVRNDVIRHNASCPNKVHLFDFMMPSPITRDDAAAYGRESRYYLDPIHVRPQTGLLLLKRMLEGRDTSLAAELAGG
jgi:hypothetical protein